MKVIRESAEHHFLTTLSKIKTAPSGWIALYFALSRNLKHRELIQSPTEIKDKIERARQKSAAFMDGLTAKIQHVPKGHFYIFSDQDVVLNLHAEEAAQQARIQATFKEIAATLPAGFSDMGLIGKEFQKYQKLADQKLLSAQRFEAYECMCDLNKIESLHLRRARRDTPKVLLVEDDRFTASYASNILGNEYDLIVARNGEEGLKAYIDHAPDVVFLDIHLPGMNGHETLQAIRAVDPEAFVVMLSVDTARTSIVQATKMGAQTFLKKPFSKERLLETVKHSPYVRSMASSNTGILH